MSRRPKRASARRARKVHAAAPRLDGRVLRVGDQTLPLYSGAMHYWRVDRAAWAPSLQQLRNLGLRMVETYVPWQVHEVAPGEYDFGSREPRNDLGAFLDLAAELELFVFVRPGPHINAEMTFFGLPERIVFDAACQARSPRQNPVVQGFPPRMFPVPSYASDTFHEEVGRWFDAVGEVVAPRLWPRGPVVLVQVDNEASYYFRDAPYDQDYHPDALREWRRFLERRYGTLRATNEAHGEQYRRWTEVEAPTAFEAGTVAELVPHLDWVTFKEQLLTDSLRRMHKRMVAAGLGGVPTVHNLPLGDLGVALSAPALEEDFDLVGLDYYHARREHRTIKRRTLYMAGTSALPYAPELGVGAPAWFTPLSNDDSLFTALCALAYGLRGFNLYMAVDRDRWYGAPIDGQGNPRVDAGVWKQLLARLREVGFHALSRQVEVGLMLPREYARLSKATSLLGFLSPTVLDAVYGNPVAACREDDFGLPGPIQVLWWKMVARFAEALTAAGIPFAYVDGDAPQSRLERFRVLVTPSFEYCDPARWRRVCAFAESGGQVVYGPAMPAMDLHAQRRLFEVPRDGRRLVVDADADAVTAVAELIDQHELRTPYRVGPRPLETCLHEDTSGGRVLFIINPSKAALEATVELGTSTSLVDLLNGERYSGMSSVRVPVDGWTCRMFEVVIAASEDSGSGEAVAS